VCASSISHLPSRLPLRIPLRRLNRGQIHISKAQSPDEDPKLSSQAAKLMHRLTVDEVMAKMDSVEK